MKLDLSREEVSINKVTVNAAGFLVEVRVPVEMEDFPDGASEVKVTSVPTVDVYRDGSSGASARVTLTTKTLTVSPGKVAKATLLGADDEDMYLVLAWFREQDPLCWYWNKED